MTQPPTFLNCSPKTAFITFVLIGLLFSLAGCAAAYKMFGLTEDQVTEQTSEDNKVIIRTITQVRTTLADILTTSIAAGGAILSGFLAKWLGTERKLVKTMITGVEKAGTDSAKASIKTAAKEAGVEDTLHARILKYT